MADHGASTPAADDPLLWLEDVDGARALDWVRAENAVTGRALAEGAEFAALRTRLLAILDAKERIPWINKRGRYVYNFWQDERHVKGIWRRTTLADYKHTAPDWETVLDLDKLAAEEKENWVWAGPVHRKPFYDRALVSLSRGGGDAAVVREFDLAARAFVRPDEGGFALPEAKSSVAWRERDAIYVATDFGPDSLTASGYSRIVKEWRRGTPIADAKTIFSGAPEDVSVSPAVSYDRGHVYEMVVRSIGFFTHEYRLRRGDTWLALDVPNDSNVLFFADFMLLRLRSDWRVGGRIYSGGALLAAKLDAYLAGKRDLAVLFEPGPRKSLAEINGTRTALMLNELENVRNRLYVLRPGEDGQWTRERMDVSDVHSVSASGLDPDGSDDFLLYATGYTQPATLSLGTVGGAVLEPLKQEPARFDSTGLDVIQFEAVSRDGTHIPYFQVSRRDLAPNGENPTLLYGYGGFEVSLRPGYDALNGAGWLERGGVYAVANIRGGGEFGPAWHKAALRENRQRAYDDFAAVAEDLIRRGVTSPRHLGIEGGSNGGLLVGVMLTQRPELFRAVVCSVPLLDMARYHTLLAGASWMEEYGDPGRDADWAWLRAYSPYHNLAAGRAYPHVLFMTSTRDDRVHPGHARKMAARMKAMGCDVLYYENIEGGHGGAADNPQYAYMKALAYTFLWRKLASAR